MTKNESYLFAKKIYRQHLSHKELEELMKDYPEEDLKLVKGWLSQWTNGQ